MVFFRYGETGLPRQSRRRRGLIGFRTIGLPHGARKFAFGDGWVSGKGTDDGTVNRLLYAFGRLVPLLRVIF